MKYILRSKICGTLKHRSKTIKVTVHVLNMTNTLKLRMMIGECPSERKSTQESCGFSEVCRKVFLILSQ